MSPEPQAAKAGREGRKGRSRADTWGKVVVVVCGLALLGRFAWEQYHPVVGQLRWLRYGTIEARKEASKGLAENGAAEPDAVIPALVAATKDEDRDVRVEALGALRVLASGKSEFYKRDDMTNAFIVALSDSDPEVRSPAAAALATYPGGGDRLIMPLFDAMERDDPVVTEFCGKALARLVPSETLRPEVVKKLGSPSRAARARAAEVLGRCGLKAQEAVPALVATLREPKGLGAIERPKWAPDVDPACEAALALGLIAPMTAKSDEARSALEETLRNDNTPARRKAAARSLLWFKPDPKNAVPVLVSALKGAATKGDPGDWLAIADALTSLGPKTPRSADVVAAFAESLATTSPKEREAAARLLRLFADDARAAVPALIQALKEATNTKGHENDGPVIAKTLGMLAPGAPSADEAIAALTNALAAGNPELTRLDATVALTEFGQRAKSAVPALKGFLKEGNPDAKYYVDVALKAIEAGP